MNVAEEMAVDVSDEETVPSSYQIATTIGVRADELQLRKASFFGQEDGDDMEGEDGESRGRGRGGGG